MARNGVRKFQFQFGWGGLLALCVSTVCVLLWMFILGLWVGEKITGRPSPEATLATPEGASAPPPPLSPATLPQVGQESQAQGGAAVEVEQEPVPEPSAPLGEGPIPELGNVPPPATAPPETPPEGPQAGPEPSAPVAGGPPTKVPPPPAPEQRPTLAKTTFFALQIASYREKARADREADRWREKGYQVQALRADLGPQKGVWYRVYLGRFRSMDEATGSARTLARTEGLKSYVVPMRDQ